MRKSGRCLQLHIQKSIAISGRRPWQRQILLPTQCLTSKHIDVTMSTSYRFNFFDERKPMTSLFNNRTGRSIRSICIVFCLIHFAAVTTSSIIGLQPHNQTQWPCQQFCRHLPQTSGETDLCSDSNLYQRLSQILRRIRIGGHAMLVSRITLA
jgi:hypothetical protein